MFSCIVNHTNSGKNIDEVLIDVPLGKYHLSHPNEAKVQSGQQLDTCWYYARNYIRPRYGKAFDPAIDEGRKIEKLISSYRKTSYSIQDKEQLHNVILQGYEQLFGTRSKLTSFQVQIRMALLSDFLEKPNEDRQMKLDAEYELDLYRKDFLIQDKFEYLEEYLKYLLLEKSARAYEELYSALNVDLKQVLTDYYYNNETLFCRMTSRLEFEQKIQRLQNLQSLPLADKCRLYDCAFPTVISRAYGLIPLYWHPSKGISGLFSLLREKGPLVVSGFFGVPFYKTKAHVLSEKFGDQREIFGWHPGEFTNESLLDKRAHAIVIIGVKKENAKEYVYFLDPTDPSDPSTKGKLYKMSFQRLREGFSDQNGLHPSGLLKGPFGYHADVDKMNSLYLSARLFKNVTVVTVDDLDHSPPRQLYTKYI